MKVLGSKIYFSVAIIWTVGHLQISNCHLFTVMTIHLPRIFKQGKHVEEEKDHLLIKNEIRNNTAKHLLYDFHIFKYPQQLKQSFWKPHTQPAQHGNASSCCYQSPGIPEADKDTLVFCQHEEAETVNTNLHKELLATISRQNKSFKYN